MSEKCCIGDGSPIEGLISHDVDPISPEQMAALFKALGDMRRLEIMEIVADEGDACACVLLDELEISPSTLSHHTRILTQAGLLKCCRKGKWAHYLVNESGIEAARALLGHLSRQNRG